MEFTITGKSPAGVEWRVYHDRYPAGEARDQAIETQKTRLAKLWKKKINGMNGRLVKHSYARSEGWSLFLIVGAGREPYSVRTVRIPRYSWEDYDAATTKEERFATAQKTITLFDMYALCDGSWTPGRLGGVPKRCRFDGKNWY